MEAFRKDGRSRDRRFMVVVDLLEAGGEVYSGGDVLNEVVLGSLTEDLLRIDAIREDDYRLDRLFDGADDAPKE